MSLVTVSDLDNLVEQIATIKKEIEAMEAAATLKNKELAVLQGKAFNYLRELDREDYKSPFGNLSIKTVYQVKNPQTDEDKKSLFDWMREKGIYEKYAQVHASALKSLFLAEREEYIKQGNDPMLFSLPGMAPATMFETVNFTKSRS